MYLINYNFLFYSLDFCHYYYYFFFFACFFFFFFSFRFVFEVAEIQWNMAVMVKHF